MRIYSAEIIQLRYEHPLWDFGEVYLNGTVISLVGLIWHNLVNVSGELDEIF